MIRLILLSIFLVLSGAGWIDLFRGELASALFSLLTANLAFVAARL